jgi:hypothetical protein
MQIYREGISIRILRSWLLVAVALFAAADVARAQTTSGTISGHVVDAQGLVLPGVTVNATSPNRQGILTTTTSGNGDYIFTALPAGVYTISFELSGFQQQQRTVTIAPTQTLPLDVTMGPAALTETVFVVGSADVQIQTAQVATNFKQDLVAMLPTNRDINSYLLLAPSVHPTGPRGAYSISGSVSYENLFLVNGVTVNENLRGQANDLYIEDAIQETNVATAGVSAEYGRFSGGVVNVVTKSGGNQFTGSLRETFNNDGWRTLTPYENTSIADDPAHKETRVSRLVPTHEYTVGGPVLKDRLWFFTAGRIQTQTEGRQLVSTNIPYTFKRPTRRFEGKGTFSATSNHRFQAVYTKIIDDQVNNTFDQTASMDLNSLETRKLPQDLYVVNYSGVITPTFFVEGLVSKRHFTFQGSGAKSTDLIDGTLMIDNARGWRYWSATFCGICDPEKRDNEDFYGKGTYFLSKKGFGSHTMVFGGDAFNDVRSANNHQSGSDYRILGTGSIVRGTGESAVIYPVLLGNGTTRIQWNPIPIPTKGSSFRTYSAFYNDNWRVNGKLTANLGVRWDKNHGLDQQGNLVVTTSTVSPRLGVVLDPAGDGKWSVTASFAKYAAAISNSVADAASAAGNPQQFRFFYRGPDINPDANAANLTPTPAAIRQVFDWYTANGGANLPFADAPTIPGVARKIGSALKSPSVLEYATGVNRQFGTRAAARADVVYRDYRDLYVYRQDTSTGKVTAITGQQFDLTLVENTNDLKRRYAGLTTQGTYRFTRADAGATYTLSRSWGNFNGENAGSGPTPGEILQYPEYKQASWNYPEGDLQTDQRHRARLWVNYGLPWVNGLTLSLLETLESGVPYGANNLNNTSANGVDPRPYVTNPGYLTPPTGPVTNYFFTARDAFRAERQARADFAANYTYGLKTGNRRVDLFFQAQVINLFNQFQLCGCGDTVFLNGGTVTQTRIDQTIRTAVSNPTLYQPFNPFTTMPVKGVNWDYGPNFGKGQNRFAYTSPRTVRIGFGVRF